MKLSPLTFVASLILAGAPVLSSATAFAQTVAPVSPQQAARPAPTPIHVEGAVSRYMLSPAGRIRALVLDNGTTVMIHGRGAQRLVGEAAVGTAVRVDGFTHDAQRGIVRHATVTRSDGTVLVTARPWEPSAARVPGTQWRDGRRGERRAHAIERLAQLPTVTANGTVQSIVAGQRGGVHALLLADGTTVTIGHRLGREIRTHGIHVGDTVHVTGHGGNYAQGMGVFAEHVTFSDGSVLSVPLTPPAQG